MYLKNPRVRFSNASCEVIFEKRSYLFSNLLKPEIQSFIRQHESDDLSKLILKSKEVHGVQIASVATQIEGRKKAKEKLPIYYSTERIIYPAAVNMEQSSSEATAKFKSNVALEKISGRSLCVDLTGGLGVDSFFLSRVFNEVSYIEPNAELLEIAKHNHVQLGVKNISYHNVVASAFLKSAHPKIDFVYLDPSRRDSHNRKVSSLASCEPNVLELLPSMFQRAQYVLLKTSPLLDITEALKQLEKVSQVSIVSVDNQCKEVLFLLDETFITEPSIEAINLSKRPMSSFRFSFSEEKEYQISFSEPQEFIYEPNASVLKAGAFKSIAARFGVEKIHPSTHLYTSKNLVAGFPGRIFKIVDLVKSDPKVLKQYFPDGNANIFTRNYPLSPQDLKAKSRLNDGGNRFLIGFTGLKKKYLAVAEKVS
ncbi:MAG TPA: class I SAM-dependent methyltransferase [Chryseolinea sp.]|nr:class I SAM-dependent methyltransferase [Chryseolinea sp.]